MNNNLNLKQMSEEYEFIENIGQGMYGRVYKARNKKENKYYAIKRLNFKDINEKEKKQINNEVSCIKKLKHPNIILYKDSFNDEDNYFNIVTTFCEGGDIYNKIQNQKGEYFSEEQILNWMVQILLGLDYIHKKDIIHRDIKPQNIFIKNRHIICIGDFGIAKIINQIQTQTMTSIIGTPLYMSPESFNEPNSKYFESDIWSTGCCLYEMCNLKHAFGADRWELVFNKVRTGKHQPVNKKYSNELRDIIDSMLNVKPINRPTIPKLLKNTFIRPKAANYIKDYIKNYKLYDGNEEQVLILKEQAEKYGIFKTKLNREMKESSQEKEIKIKKNNYKINIIRKDFSNPKSQEKEEQQKKYSLDKKKKNKLYEQKDYKNNINKKIRNNISGNNKKNNNRVEYVSDDNKKKHYNNINNKETLNPSYNYNNNCHRIKYSLSKKKNERASSRPLSSQKFANNNNLVIKKHNISVITKKEDNNKKENLKEKENEENIKIKKLNESYNNENTKEKIINERINFFKNKCIDSLKEEKFEKAYNYLVTIRKKNENDVDNRDIREHLIRILGKDNIGYWHLIDQIILFEQMLIN